MNAISTAKTVRRLSGLVAVGALALTGCGPEDKPAQPASSSSASTNASAPTGANANPSSAAGANTGTTGGEAQPGQTFKLGQAANVPFTYGKSKGTIDLTVTSIDQGDPADLASLNLGDQVKGKVPFYIRYSVKNTGSSDLSFTTVDHIKGQLPDGTGAQDLLVIGDFAKCKTAELPSGFTTGKVAQGCAVSLAPSASVKVTSAEYWGDPFTLDKGLIWK
ncbi:hypothetical protein ACIHFE_14640 [Streptomyces sp. NPDC052396]|uniref:hypothetical protein n=1 Tax=Streptomyces sp. NPDC052396 TaxID=3365689 RepID=UPI0037D2C0C5